MVEYVGCVAHVLQIKKVKRKCGVGDMCGVF